MTRIAEWALYGKHRNAPLSEVHVVVHAPELDPASKHGDYRTLVELNGIAEPKHIFGVNSMQSLVLAMRVLQVRIQSALDDGWQFYFEQTDSKPFDLLGSITPSCPEFERDEEAS